MVGRCLTQQAVAPVPQAQAIGDGFGGVEVIGAIQGLHVDVVLAVDRRVGQRVGGGAELVGRELAPRVVARADVLDQGGGIGANGEGADQHAGGRFAGRGQHELTAMVGAAAVAAVGRDVTAGQVDIAGLADAEGCRVAPILQSQAVQDGVLGRAAAYRRAGDRQCRVGEVQNVGKHRRTAGVRHQAALGLMARGPAAINAAQDLVLAARQAAHDVEALATQVTPAAGEAQLALSGVL